MYYQKEPWGDVAIQHNGQVHHFSNLVSLIGFLQSEHDNDFDLVEVTDVNYHELYNAGAFDDQ